MGEIVQHMGRNGTRDCVGLIMVHYIVVTCRTRLASLRRHLEPRRRNACDVVHVCDRAAQPRRRSAFEVVGYD